MENVFLTSLKLEDNKTLTQNGAITNRSTLNKNLDLFAATVRYLPEEKIVGLFIQAYSEDKKLAIKNFLHLLDIRGGKGERRASRIILNYILSNADFDLAEKCLTNISELGRWDYIIDLIVEKYSERIEQFILDIIVKGLEGNDLLIYKWMPSTRGARKHIAKKFQELTGMQEKDYRQLLSRKRAELNLIETALTTKNYDNVDFSKIPSKAMLKYRLAFARHMKEEYSEFLGKVELGEVKINANNLMLYDIIEKAKFETSWQQTGFTSQKISENERKLLEAMWENQPNFVPEGVSAMVVADTSASMNGRPLCASLGLAMYFAERNNGDWKNKFITFSKEARFVELPENVSFLDRLKAVDSIAENTNIDSVFDLVLKAAMVSPEAAASMPEYLLIVSDMEFDEATRGDITNFENWNTQFGEQGLKLPKIIFWTISQFRTQCMPVVHDTKHAALISGFSPAVLPNLFTIDELTPETQMLHTLEKYDKYLE